MENSPTGKLPDDPAMHCSFCDTPHFQVRKLIAGPGVFICDECVDVCNTIIQEATLQDAPSPAARVQAMAQIAREATRKLELLAEWSTDMERAADAGTKEFPTGGDTRH